MTLKAKPQPKAAKKRPGRKRVQEYVEIKAEPAEYARRDVVLALNPAWRRWLNGLARHSGRSKQALIADGLRTQAIAYQYAEPMPARFLI